MLLFEEYDDEVGADKIVELVVELRLRELLMLAIVFVVIAVVDRDESILLFGYLHIFESLSPEGLIDFSEKASSITLLRVS